MKLIKSDNRIIYVGWLDSKSNLLIYILYLAVYPGTHSVLWEQTVGVGIPVILKKWEGFEHLEINHFVKVLRSVNVNILFEEIATL